MQMKLCNQIKVLNLLSNTILIKIAFIHSFIFSKKLCNLLDPMLFKFKKLTMTFNNEE